MASGIIEGLRDYTIYWRDGHIEKLTDVSYINYGDFHLRVRRMEIVHRRLAGRTLWKSRREVTDERSWARKADGILRISIKEHQGE